MGANEEDVRQKRIVVHRRLELLPRRILLSLEMARQRRHEERFGTFHVGRLRDRHPEQRRRHESLKRARRSELDDRLLIPLELLERAGVLASLEEMVGDLASQLRILAELREFEAGHVVLPRQQRPQLGAGIHRNRRG